MVAVRCLRTKSIEEYDAELERMNTAMSAENQTLMNDNKQLNALIKEYEQTLENLMATFRTRAVRPSPLWTSCSHRNNTSLLLTLNRTKYSKGSWHSYGSTKGLSLYVIQRSWYSHWPPVAQCPPLSGGLAPSFAQ